ncbi:hypothetical protein SAMN06295926_104298 [Lysinibacillus sp. AC-3]|nr:hypothetical protein SAMN06295926_104298 [Lysinibacillus sp. AC-3]
MNSLICTEENFLVMQSMVLFMIFHVIKGQFINEVKEKTNVY